MRIGFDMLAVQSPHHGPRGIGRYSASLVGAVLGRDDPHEYVLYVHDDLDDGRVPRSERAEVRRLRPRWELGEGVSSLMDRLARVNPDRLDALVVLSPFERWNHYTPPVRSDNNLLLASVVYDLIPFLFQNEAEVDPVLIRHYRTLETLTRYDALLAISDATRNDCLSVLKLPTGRVTNISGASDPAFFRPGPSAAPDQEDHVLSGLGIDRPFVLNVGGLDVRKNTWKLIDAYAALPTRVRERNQLVLTFMVNEWGRSEVTEYVRRRGLEGSVVLTGHVPDETLRLLYQRCEVFAFPSLYEGFGLPLLEAMHCGAVVVAGNNSSQIEVVGDAGLLAEADDVGDVAAKIAAVLDDPSRCRTLRDRAVVRASQFSWERTAARTLGVLTDLAERAAPRARLRVDRAHRRKPRLAFFSPLPPMRSGISDYSALLLDELRRSYRIDLYHDAGYVPEPALACGDYAAADYRLFDRVAAAEGYHAVVYQMGNSKYHSYFYSTMRRHPGVVTLHDFCLANFHVAHGRSNGVGHAFLHDELLRTHPGSADAIRGAIATWGDDHETIERDCASNGWYLNSRVVESAQVLVLHSPWCASRAREALPEHADRVAVIPFGVHPRRTGDAEKRAVRDKFGLPHDALVVASYGYVNPDKMGSEALDAFAAVARHDPKAVFLFVGEEVDGGRVRGRAEAHGLNDRVRFLGRQTGDAFDALMTVTDLGVNLRRPPTNGETSAALMNLLASGVATIVTDVATFSDPPSDVVRKVRGDDSGHDLADAVWDLCTDHAKRAGLGRSAREFVGEHHDWRRVAGLYVDAIERCHREQRDGGAVRPGRPALPGVRR